MAYAKPTDATSFELNENYDFDLDETGRLGMKEGIESTQETLRFDLEELQNWVLRNTLGMDWINEDGTGLLQTTGNEQKVVSAVQRKVSSRDDIVSINSMVYSTNKDKRTIQIKLSITTKDFLVEEIVLNL